MGFAIAGAAVAGDMFASNAASSAASSEEAAAAQSAAVQQQEFNTIQTEEQPYRDAGTNALSQLSTSLPDLTRKFTSTDFQEDPGYQFQLQQGQSAVQNSAAARGLLNSSAAMKDMDTYTQGTANTDYQQALNNFTNNQQQRYNMLAGVASGGQGAISQVNSAGANAANNTSAAIQAGGNAAAASTMAGANAANTAIGTGVNAWTQQQYLNSMKNGTNSSGAPTSAPNGDFQYTSPTLGQLE